ncbi:protein NDUFAF4 homolog [Odontomachus brunneus]|uniref:protein NDUFAF4 homolog n=1 Tax=Odontomachus brunneus TaxID=486640 RepID=UPI0013F1C4DF|nr:protein NDUFAF4 homolog [Odontomachus brunneus]XP_032675044.1 protein NDUFAF4 homolog [Odontomachus brunneus]XP_032675045.1 protein NDUFAF4 homolog [Odontomachus brunneus]XP_032675046.1 protein NDUFAF4 homolog [Odontomachus brunneus]XP_032675047.1 protein NDUFAF4 homolog [Odontomachus brunneus]XP_032675049.1 protein NDUFAF4 homolog [Odontomachus brunneus]XP_032675050.1 protein NDUFAF4 homolog [Odontomachus brunneus]
MGIVYSRLMRSARTFNIANRAERIISREKPIPAPQYTSAEKQKKLVDEVYPGFLEKQYQKDMRLDQRLKDVFVTSTDPQDIKSKAESKFLPQNRQSITEFSIDFYEPAVISEGKCTLRQAFTFISQHRDDPIKYNSENIAAEYKLDKKVIDNILKHFKIYVSVLPEAPDKPISDPLQELIDQSYKDYKETFLTEEKK